MVYKPNQISSILFCFLLRLQNSRSYDYVMARLPVWHWGNSPGCDYPLNTWRDNNVVITSTRRHFDVITWKWRRFDVMTSLLRNVSTGCMMINYVVAAFAVRKQPDNWMSWHAFLNIWIKTHVGPYTIVSPWVIFISALLYGISVAKSICKSLNRHKK